MALASALVDPQSNILQTLADTILDVTQCDSSGLSLLTKDGKSFYWPAIAGNSRPSQNEDGIFQSERGLGIRLGVYTSALPSTNDTRLFENEIAAAPCCR